jgi:hypothetical protein
VTRFIAVDWSGRTANAGAAIWLAEVRAGSVMRLEGGRDREKLVNHLIEEAEADGELVVGLDFAFSFPAWFVGSVGAGSAIELWEVVNREGESWLTNPDAPFTRTSRPFHERWFRRTELELRRLRYRPKPVFQVGGIGQVGTGSLRGMPFLLRLRERFAIWPFDEPRLPLIVEIYPRLYAAQFADRLDGAPNEHARDALASAHAMAAWAGNWRRLPRDSRYELEGRIWHPEIVQRPE